MRTTWVRPNIAAAAFAGLALLGTGLQLAQPATTPLTQVHAVQLAALQKQKPEPREPGAPTGTTAWAPVGGPIPIPPGPPPIPWPFAGASSRL
jgi:hypothetical protein